MSATTSEYGDRRTKFARRLLATTCLTAAAAPVAQGAAINETSFGDFGNTLGTRTLVGSGVTKAVGQINPSGDNDFFQLDGLTPTSSYAITGVYTASATYAVLDTLGNQLTAPSNN